MFPFRKKSQLVLGPFTRRPAGTKLFRARFVISIGMFCFFCGAAFALMAPYFLMPFFGIVTLLVLLVVWALPDIGRAPTRLLEALLFTFIVVLVLWPNYLAISLPGLPWITLLRLTSVPMTVILLVCLSASSAFRSRLSAIMKSAPLIGVAVLAFAIIQVISVAFSAARGESFNQLIVAQTNGTVVFVVACYVCAKERHANRVAATIFGLAIVVGLIGIAEYRLGRVLWAGHIPEFLHVADPIVEKILAGMDRSGIHRVQSTYTTSLGLAEYFAIVFPFFIYFFVSKRQTWVRVVALAAIPLLVAVIGFTQSRIGFVGLLIASTAYPMAWYAIRWWRDRQNLLAASVVFLSPLLVMAVVAASLTIPAIKYRTLGTGMAQVSTQARIEQMHMGIPKILHQPWGYGIGQSGTTLGYRNRAGFMTIDSNWLKLALDFGILGLAVYFCIFGSTFYYAARGAFAYGNCNSGHLFIPIGLSLLNYLVAKAVFAQDDNQPLVFLLIGMAVGLTHRLSTNDPKTT